jgi:hypothetical protein
MILAALAAIVLTPPKVVELIDTSAPVVSVHAMVPVPALGARDQAILGAMAVALTEDTETYGKQQWRDVAARAGSVLKCELMPDHIDVSLEVLPEDAKTAISFLHAIVRRAKLPAEALNRALETLPFRHRSFLEETLRPEQLDYRRIRRQEIVDMYQRLFRPETVVLAVGGKIEPGLAAGAWNGLIADWTAPRMRFQAPDRSAPPYRDKLDADVSMIELRGSEFVAGDVAMPTRLLALVGLGTGKGSSLFRVVRERHGWSYLQTAVLWPSPTGFVPKLLVAQSSRDGVEARTEEIRAELLADVKAWTTADLDRAKGMVGAILGRGLEVNPFYFRRVGPMTQSIEDRTFMSGYWAMKTGTDWNPSQLLSSMAKVSLEDIRQSATDLLTGASAKVYRSR